MPNASSNTPADPRIMLWGMFLASTAMYVFVIMFAVEKPQVATIANIVKTLTTDGTSMALSLVTLASVIGSIVLSRAPLTAAPKDYSLFLIRCAIAQMPAIFGLVIALSTSQPVFVWIGSAVTAVLLLLNKPSTANAI